MVVRAKVDYRRSSLTLVDHALGSLCLLWVFAVLEPDWNDGRYDHHAKPQLKRQSQSADSNVAPASSLTRCRSQCLSETVSHTFTLSISIHSTGSKIHSLKPHLHTTAQSGLSTHDHHPSSERTRTRQQRVKSSSAHSAYPHHLIPPASSSLPRLVNIASRSMPLIPKWISASSAFCVTGWSNTWSFGRSLCLPR